MKVIKLKPEDSDIFQTEISPSRCEYLINHFETFMQMYKSQRSTFWLRLLISFKVHTEDRVFTSEKWCSLVGHYQYHFMRALSYVYVCIHKKFIEGSNTAVKKFINNLITLALHSPTYLKYSCEEWLMYLKSSKQLQNNFQNVSGISEPCEYGSYTVLIFSVFIDFLCALCSVFEQWCEKSDLSDDEVKKIDSKIIYWLPTFNSECKIKPLCFEKYLSDFWKKDLQRMLLTDDIHNIFGDHDTSGCCEKFIKEKNLVNAFHFPNKHIIELMKFMNITEKDLVEEKESTDFVSTVTEVCLKDICVLKPHAKLCSLHENCFVRIFHNETCLEPFLCTGVSPCVLTCETNLKDKKKETKADKFWKNISVEKFSVNENKTDASTSAESYDKFIETYLHIKETIDIDVPLSVLRHTYQCMSELHNFDFNPRRTECLNRLRKKLTQKHPTNSYQFNFRQPFYRESLLEDADRKMMKLQVQVCSQRNHNLFECEGRCFLQDVNSVAIDSCNAFGRVINLTKTSVTVPPMCERQMKAESQKSECIKCTKNVKTQATEKKVDKNSKSKSVQKVAINLKSNSPETSGNATANLKEVGTTPPIDLNAGSNANADDEIDEILKLIGMNDDVNQQSADDKTSVDNHAAKDLSSKEEETVDNFFQLIGVKMDEPDIEPKNDLSNSLPKDDKKLNLKICAYCKKKETQRKMFKKCSKCKQENFPVQHYYCSQECLKEDWLESHEQEHLKYQKGLS